MLLGIQNLIEYLNRVYFKDENIEREVVKMTRTLYDPEVEKRGIEKGIEEGKRKAKIENAKNLLDILDDETISKKIGLDIEVVRRLRVEI